MICLVLGSCDAEKRIARIVKKNPSLVKTKEIVIHDTITGVLPVLTPRAAVQLKSSIKDLNYPILKTVDQLTVKLSLEGDTLRVDAACDTLTIYEPYEIPIEVKGDCPTIEINEQSTFFEKVRAFGIGVLFSDMCFFFIYRRARDAL